MTDSDNSSINTMGEYFGHRYKKFIKNGENRNNCVSAAMYQDGNRH